MCLKYLFAQKKKFNGSFNGSFQSQQTKLNHLVNIKKVMKNVPSVPAYDMKKINRLFVL